MGFPALEFFKRAQVRVLIVQACDEAQGDLVVFHVVQERAAVGLVIHRPTGSVDDQAGLVARRVHFPQFLDTDAVALRVTSRVELEFLDELLAQVAT